MTNNNQTEKRFYENLLRWCKERDSILEEIEIKLYEMRQIAEYGLNETLTKVERARLNDQLDELKNDVYALEKQLEYVVH